MKDEPKKRGRKPFNPLKETPTDRRSRLKHGSHDWRMVRLQRMLEPIREAQFTESKTRLKAERKAAVHERERKRWDEALLKLPETFRFSPGDYLSARAALISEQVRKGRFIEIAEVDALWRNIYGQLEQAVLDGDALWFKRQAKAISHAKKPVPKDQFAAKVEHLLTLAMIARVEPAEGWIRSVEGWIRLDDMPPRDHCDWTGELIYAQLKVKKLPHGGLLVEGRTFGARGTHTARNRVLTEIHRMAKRRGVPLRKQQGKRPPTDKKSKGTR